MPIAPRPSSRNRPVSSRVRTYVAKFSGGLVAFPVNVSAPPGCWNPASRRQTMQPSPTEDPSIGVPQASQIPAGLGAAFIYQLLCGHHLSQISQFFIDLFVRRDGPPHFLAQDVAVACAQASHVTAQSNVRP